MSHLRWVLVLALCSAAVLLGAKAGREPYRRDLAAFRADDRIHPARPGEVVMYGSSTLAYWTNVAEFFPGVTIVNRAIAGTTTKDLVSRYSRVIHPRSPRAFMIYTGANDLAAGATPEGILASLEQLLALMDTNYPKAEFLLMSIRHTPARTKLREAEKYVSDRIRELANRRTNTVFVDVASSLLDSSGRPEPRYIVPDGIHLTQEGYQVMARVLRPHVERWKDR